MFQSKWIAPHAAEDNSHFCFLREFPRCAEKRYTITITAHDCYKLYINGAYVGQGPAAGYPFRYRFNAYDMTPFLHDGNNKIEVHVYYQGLKNRVWVSGDGNAGMIADVFEDEKYVFGTDSTWRYRRDVSFTGGDVLGYDTAYTENRDMTRPPAPLQPARESESPFTFDDAPFPAVEIVTVAANPKISGNVYRCDFGRAYVGTIAICATANADGAKLILRCGEERSHDGSVRFDMRCGCRYEETVILKCGENRLEQFDYKGLRYLEIVADEGVKITDCILLARRFPAPQSVQEIHTKDSHLQAVFDLCKDTVLWGVQEQYIDCPTREKGQYLGDAYVTGFAHYYLTGESRLLKKALFDFADSVRYGGRFLSVAPCALEQKIADYDLLYPHFLLQYYRLTGDRKTLETLAGVCTQILGEYARFENADRLLENVTGAWNLVDWPQNMRDDYRYRPDGDEAYGLHSVLCAYYVFAHSCTEEIFAVLNRDFTPRADEIKAAYYRRFWRDATGLFADCAGSNHHAVHANMLPLALGICAPEHQKHIADYLLKRGMACSVYMAYFYLKALCEAGYRDEALQILTSDAPNSWRNMINEGATATFEAWGKEQKWNTSLFHPWACAPILILNEYFAHLLQKNEK